MARVQEVTRDEPAYAVLAQLVSSPQKAEELIRWPVSRNTELQSGRRRGAARANAPVESELGPMRSD